MSKKAKSRKSKGKKKRATALDNAKAVANNAAELAKQYGAEITNLTADLAEMTKKWEEARDNALRAGAAKVSSFGRIDQLKLVISGLERDLAQQIGYTRALEKQIDNCAEKVMVRPPVMLTPSQAAEFNSGTVQTNTIHVDRAADLLRAWNRTDGVGVERRHWTAL